RHTVLATTEGGNPDVVMWFPRWSYWLPPGCSPAHESPSVRIQVASCSVLGKSPAYTQAPQSGFWGQVSRRPELPGLDGVVLHLQVQGLVVDSEESRRRTLVPLRGLKGQANRP